MTTIQAALAVISSVVLPFIIQAIKSEAMGGNAARWLAIAVSALFGALTAIANGTPDRPPALGSPPSSPASAACRWHTPPSRPSA